MALQRAPLAGLRRDIFAVSPARTLALVRAAWPGAVGPELSRRTEVVALEGATLRVRVPDAGWRKVLHRMQRDILTRLQLVAGELAPRKLGFMEGSLVGSGPETAHPPDPPQDLTPRSASPTLLEAAQVILDGDLRERFLQSACSYLARSRPSR